MRYTTFYRSVKLLLAGALIVGLSQSIFALGSIREKLAAYRASKTTLSDTTTLTNASAVSNIVSSKVLLNSVDKKVSIRIGDGERFYLLHIPKGYSIRKGASLVLAFHGGGGNAQNMKNGYDILKKSDKEGFIVIFPNGYSQTKNGGLATWNAGNCCGTAETKDIDDVEFVRQIIQKVTSEYKINKVFAIGMSNGAMMSYRLACEIPELIDGIGTVAGTDNTKICQPSESTPVMHIHALNDDHVLYNGGCGPACVSPTEPEFVSVPDTIKKWTEINMCTGNPRIVTGSGVTCQTYASCAGGNKVRLCTTDTGGHSWPGIGYRLNPRKGDKEPPSQAINATDELWKFFSSLQ